MNFKIIDFTKHNAYMKVIEVHLLLLLEQRKLK